MPGSSRKMARDFDRESGKNRVTRKDKKPAPVESEDEDFLDSDDDLESELDIPAKDDTRRKKSAPPPPARKGNRRDGRSRAIKGEEDRGDDLANDKKTETESKIAPHMAILLASTYHMGLSSIARPSTSSFIPSGMNFFIMVEAMLSLIGDNTILHEMCPEFFSPVVTLYYGHVFYYHILRARNAAGSDVLTRLERRALTYYERIGPAEAWPVAAPLLGMLQYFGSHKTEDPMFGWIVPALPDFSSLKHNGIPNALGSMASTTGIARIPLIPALQKLVYNFAHSIATFADGMIQPVGQANIDASHTFCGIESSSGASTAFQSLTGNVTWFAPSDTGEAVSLWDYTVKRARIRRWNVPDVTDTTDCSSLSGFLGFNDNQSFEWMKYLLRTSAIVNRFFPGSGNLAQVSPLSTIGSATLTYYKAATAVTPKKDKWFYARGKLTVSARGYTNTESGLLDTKMAIAVAPNVTYLEQVHKLSVAPDETLKHCRTGPFFQDDASNSDYERRASVVTENNDQIDPTLRFIELITTMFDNRAGRS